MTRNSKDKPVVLVVDDDDVGRLICTELLLDNGFEEELTLLMIDEETFLLDDEYKQDSGNELSIILDELCSDVVACDDETSLDGETTEELSL